MERIKKGLWYQCKKALTFFKEGHYYYSPEDDMLNCDIGEYLVCEDERSHFGKGEVIKICNKL